MQQAYQKTYQSAGIFTRRIGNTNYRVNVHYRPDSTERMEDKILRMIEGNQQITGFQNGTACDTMNMPQMSRRSLKGVPA
jgi:hypothetical protein